VAVVKAGDDIGMKSLHGPETEEVSQQGKCAFAVHV